MPSPASGSPPRMCAFLGWAGPDRGRPCPIIAPPPRGPVLCRRLSSPPVKTWPLQGLHCVFPAGLRPGGPILQAEPILGPTEGQPPQVRSGLGTQRRFFLELCTSPIPDPKSCAVVVPASGLGCLWEIRVVWAFRVLLCAHVCIFVGLQMGVCGGGVGRGFSLAARGGLGTRPGCLCELALVTGSPANPDPGRVPYVISDTTVHTYPLCFKGRHRLHARPTCLVCVLLSTSARGLMEGSEFAVQGLGQMWMLGSYRTFAQVSSPSLFQLSPAGTSSISSTPFDTGGNWSRLPPAGLREEVSQLLFLFAAHDTPKTFSKKCSHWEHC
ncbi:uncharacterized protein LOC129547780 isoform X1 [Moschus berezovskii]|uniref:uncharacterized protein LOC129547780 isoform X1 n=1 Tax=Moschus berezovskii TaxID=68408 RepID=UPI002444DA84|nr:uncharacterized protein LOC129547780 isoform X1 [Moschus berezovskii]